MLTDLPGLARPPSHWRADRATHDFIRRCSSEARVWRRRKVDACVIASVLAYETSVAPMIDGVLGRVAFEKALRSLMRPHFLFSTEPATDWRADNILCTAEHRASAAGRAFSPADVLYALFQMPNEFERIYRVLADRESPWSGRVASGTPQILAALDAASTDRKTGGSAAARARGPSKVLLSGIGDLDKEQGGGGGDDGKKTARYRPLLQPMELRQVADPDLVWAALNKDFPWFREANLKFVRGLARVRRGEAPSVRPILLHGPSGAGKTLWATRAAEISGLAHERVTVASSARGSFISGFERTWQNSTASLPARLFIQTRCPNPLVVLDEIDKTTNGSESGGTVHDALLALTDMRQAANYFDIFLQGSLDTSGISWIAIANSIGGIPHTLLQRFRPVAVQKPTTLQAASAAHRLMLRHGIADVDGCLLEACTRAYAQTGTLRSVEQCVEDAAEEAIWSPPQALVAV